MLTNQDQTNTEKREPMIPVFDFSDALDRPNYVIGSQCVFRVNSPAAHTPYGL